MTITINATVFISLSKALGKQLQSISCNIVMPCCSILHFVTQFFKCCKMLSDGSLIQIIYIQHLPKLGDQNGSKIFWMTLDQNLETIWQGLTPKITLLLLSLTTYLFSFSRSEDDRESWLSCCGLLELFVSKFFSGLTTCFIFNTNRKKNYLQCSWKNRGSYPCSS